MANWKGAFALSKVQVNAATPPGTVEILDMDHEASDGHLVKFPVPSADPRDPLNYPVWQKATALLIVSIYAFVANFTSSIVAPAIQVWPYTFPQDPRSISELTRLIAVHVLFLGAGNIWWVPLSNWVGKRPILLVATLMMTLCSMWCGLTSSYESLVAARLLQGAGGAAADTVAPALVGDLYFIHERGRAMAVYTLFLCAGSLGGGLSGGYISHRHGWSSIFWVSVALSAFCFVGVALFVPETLYDRGSTAVHEAASETASPGSKEAGATQVEQPEPTSYKQHSFISSLGFGRPQGRLLHHAVQPWRTLALPGTWVVMLHYAGLVGGIVTIATVGPQILAMPPYLFGENSGLINVGGLIGIALGFLYTSLLADSLLKRQAKAKRRGVAEAEDRLPTLFFPLAVATGGFLVFGFCAQYPGGNRWVGLNAGFAMVAFGLMQVPSVGFNYLIDSYGALAADCFTVITILRSIIAFAWTFFVSDWVQTRGGAEPFGIFGMLMGLFSLLSIPLWVFGKRMRIATSANVERWTST